MLTAIFILLAVIWLSLSAMYHMAREQWPWQQTERRIHVLTQKNLQRLSPSLSICYWLYSIFMIVETVWCISNYTKSFAVMLVAVVLAAGIGEAIARNQAWQRIVLSWLVKVTSKYGKHLKWTTQILRMLQPIGRWIMPDRPYFRDRKELLQMVGHHYQTHKIFTRAQQEYINKFLKTDTITISSKVTPLDKATLVKADDTIVPLLLSELHDSVYGSFVVYAKRRTNIVGVLDQAVAVSHASHSAKVADIMEERLVYLQSHATYQQALQTFVETSSPISVIIDDDNQPVGVLYIQDILRDLFENTEESKQQ